MKKYIITILIALFSTLSSADSKLVNINNKCVDGYGITNSLLQFLYKFDGNLPDIKETKIKYVKFLISQVKDRSLPNDVKKRSFGELYNDPDFYQIKIQEKSASLIKELEELNLKSSPEIDKELISNLPKLSDFDEYKNPFSKIEKLVSIQNNIRDFFEELEEVRIRFEKLNHSDRLVKSLDSDSFNLGYSTALYKRLGVTSIISCNLDLLQQERLSK